jgi:hypothetical protein
VFQPFELAESAGAVSVLKELEIQIRPDSGPVQS